MKLDAKSTIEAGKAILGIELGVNNELKQF